MRALLQRVSQARVIVDGKEVGAITGGWLVLLGIGKDDRRDMIAPLVQKIVNLRLFSDPQGKFNLSLLDTSGAMLVVSQFTLYADCSQGRRPGFAQAAPPAAAKELYEEFCTEARRQKINVATGEFGADMKVDLVNDGPVTIFLES